MEIFEKIGAVLAIVGSVGGGFLFLEGRYANGEEVAAQYMNVKERATTYYQMNAAQIQRHIVEKDLEVLIKKPTELKSEWDFFKEENLKEELEYWQEAERRTAEQLD